MCVVPINGCFQAMGSPTVASCSGPEAQPMAQTACPGQSTVLTRGLSGPSLSGCLSPGRSLPATAKSDQPRSPSPVLLRGKTETLQACFHQRESFGPSPGTVCVSGWLLAGQPHPLLSSAKLTFSRLLGLQGAGSSCPALPSGNLLFLSQALPQPLLHFTLSTSYSQCCLLRTELRPSKSSKPRLPKVTHHIRAWGNVKTD